MPGPAPRPYLIEEYTRTVCPLCFAERARRSDEAGTFVDGMLVSHDGAVWMRRFCPFHGETESLYEEDLEVWRARAGWSSPTLPIVPDREDNFAGFPDGYREGLPPSHGQHTCILLLNVTDRCNYHCPACYAGAYPPGTPALRPELPSIDDVLRTVDTMLAREGGKLGVVMISGGEPTVRSDLEELLERLLERPITRVMLNTNGRRIARDDRFLAFLNRHRRRIEVYLQFDGLSPQASLTLRGEDVVAEKRRALARLNDAKLFTTLVMTVAKGVNDDEVGDVLELGLSVPRCAGLAIQPMFGSGRTPLYDPLDRATPSGVLRRLSLQTGGRIGPEAFIPLPCSHRDCCDIGYLIKAGGQEVGLPKGGKRRAAVMCAALQDLLLKAAEGREPDGCLWPSASANKPMTKKRTYEAWREIVRKAGLPPDISPHDCRLTHVNWVEKLCPEVSTTTLKEHVGHAAAGVTETNSTRPLVPAQDVLRRALDSLVDCLRA